MSQTPPAKDPSSPPPGGGPQVDWPGLIGEWSTFTQEIVDRFAQRAATNVAAASQGGYGREQWLDDLEWFWQHVGDDAARGVQICRDKYTSS